ncbi:MAG TPA: DHHA1 domain-containing protein [Anaeromyxobacteraceae bacterium]|nr:DHHA1 domain-containing protein [Anaeromyxobacteraceae bacterium]
MTQKLYLSDAYLTRFRASVAGIREVDGRIAVLLDRTAFYPEGGGQPADRGTIGGARVADVVESGEEVLHLLEPGEAPATAGEVECVVDAARRRDHVQQHHGQHLLSAAFERLHGAATLSFHLGAETCTIDLSVPPARLGPEALAAAEAEANRLVWADLPVDARERTPEELARLPLRKDAVKGSRVVVVGEGEGVVDASPCGGTHPRRTGEVGVVAVLRVQKWGQGSRVEFACGGRVLALLHRAEERLLQAATSLRCAPAEVPAAAARAAEEGQARRKELDRAVEAVAAAEAARLDAASAGPVPVAVRVEGLLATPGGLKALAQALAARGRTALLGCTDPERAHLCFARPRGPGPSMGDLLRQAVARLGGKGGGAPDLAQGSGPAREALDEALAAAAAGAGTGAGAGEGAA